MTQYTINYFACRPIFSASTVFLFTDEKYIPILDSSISVDLFAMSLHKIQPPHKMLLIGITVFNKLNFRNVPLLVNCLGHVGERVIGNRSKLYSMPEEVLYHESYQTK